MNANEFVKAMGLNAVKQFLENDNIRTKEMHDELERIVESYELVDELGGFEKAKKAFNELCEHEKDLITCGRVVLTKNELSDALLEYRRANNIFERGDYVLRNDGFWDVLKVVDINTDSAHLIRRVDGEPRWSRFKLGEIRHATNEEIKAGHRLDGLKEET